MELIKIQLLAGNRRLPGLSTHSTVTFVMIHLRVHNPTDNIYIFDSTSNVEYIVYGDGQIEYANLLSSKEPELVEVAVRYTRLFFPRKGEFYLESLTIYDKMQEYGHKFTMRFSFTPEDEVSGVDFDYIAFDNHMIIEPDGKRGRCFAMSVAVV